MLVMKFARVPTRWNPVIRAEFKTMGEFVSLLSGLVTPGDPAIPSECNKKAMVSINQEKLCKHLGVALIPVRYVVPVSGLWDEEKQGWHYLSADGRVAVNGHVSEELLAEAVSQRIVGNFPKVEEKPKLL